MAALKSKRSNGGGFRLVAGREKFGVVSDNLMRAGILGRSADVAGRVQAFWDNALIAYGASTLQPIIIQALFCS